MGAWAWVMWRLIVVGVFCEGKDRKRREGKQGRGGTSKQNFEARRKGEVRREKGKIKNLGRLRREILQIVSKSYKIILFDLF